MCPQLNDVAGPVTGAATVPETAATEGSPGTPATETQTPAGVVEATTVDKPKKAKKETKKPTDGTEPAQTPAPAKVKKAKKEAKGEGEESETEKKLLRPPMDVITREFESLITDHEIDGHKLKKLGYKCGKILFGIPSDGNGKDFRIFAYKARKKTRTVAGKSRCIFYFGLVEDAAKHAKDVTGASTTKFGKCAVQSKTPVQMVLDKVSYDESFGQNSDKVVAAMKKLIDLTARQRTASWKELLKKKTEKEKKTETVE